MLSNIFLEQRLSLRTGSQHTHKRALLGHDTQATASCGFCGPQVPVLHRRRGQRHALRREKENLCLKTMDSAIAASFYSDPAAGQESALKTSFGVIQEIISMPVKFCSSPQFFLKVRLYDQSLVQEDERIRGVPLIKRSGTSADYEQQDMHQSKETVLMRPGKIDHQVFFVDCPGWVNQTQLALAG